MPEVRLGGAVEVYYEVEWGEDLDFYLDWETFLGAEVNSGDVSAYTADFYVTDPADGTTLLDLKSSAAEITMAATNSRMTLVGAASEYSSATKDKEYNCYWLVTSPAGVPRIPAKGKIKFKAVAQ